VARGAREFQEHRHRNDQQHRLCQIQKLATKEPRMEWKPPSRICSRLNFRPEFLNRIDETSSSTRSRSSSWRKSWTCSSINLRKRLALRNLKLEVSEAATKFDREEVTTRLRRAPLKRCHPAADRKSVGRQDPERRISPRGRRSMWMSIRRSMISNLKSVKNGRRRKPSRKEKVGAGGSERTSSAQPSQGCTAEAATTRP